VLLTSGENPDPGREGCHDDVPIVFTLVGDPLASGLVRNLDEPRRT
jgi:hypothetical protein